MSMQSKLGDRGDEAGEKIRTWHLVNDLFWYIDGAITAQTVIDRHSLTGSEVTELNEVITSMSGNGNSAEKNWMLLWNALLAVERGVATWAQAKARLLQG